MPIDTDEKKWTADLEKLEETSKVDNLENIVNLLLIKALEPKEESNV